MPTSGVTKRVLRVVGFQVILLIDYTLGYVLRERGNQPRGRKKTPAQPACVCIVYILKDYLIDGLGLSGRQGHLH